MCLQGKIALHTKQTRQWNYAYICIYMESTPQRNKVILLRKLSSFWKSLKYMQHISNTYTTWFFPRQALNTGKANQNKEIALFYFWRRLQTQTDKLWKGAFFAFTLEEALRKSGISWNSQKAGPQDIPEAGLPGYPA